MTPPLHRAFGIAIATLGMGASTSLGSTLGIPAPGPGLTPSYIAPPYHSLQRGGGTKASARSMMGITGGSSVPARRSSSFAGWRSVAAARYAPPRGKTSVLSKPTISHTAPETKANGGAGIDLSWAGRDDLGTGPRGVCDWRFVDVNEVPDGQSKRWGKTIPSVGPIDDAKGEASSIGTTESDADAVLGDAPTGAG